MTRIPGIAAAPTTAMMATCFIIAVAAHLPALNANAVLDDQAAVMDNPLVQEQLNLEAIFTTNVFGNRAGYTHIPLSRPLTTLSYRISPKKNLPLHRLGNMLIHGLNASAVFIMGTTIGVNPWGAFSAGLLFAVHPVHVDAVIPLNNRSDLLCTLFLLLAFITWWRSDGIKMGAIALVLGAMAPFAKEQGIIAPALFAIPVICNLLGKKKVPTWRWTALLGSGIIVVAFLALRHELLGGIVPASISPSDNPLVLADAAQRILAPGYLLLQALRLFILPTDLSADYSRGAFDLPSSWTDPTGILGLVIFLGVVVGLLILLARTETRLVSLFGAAFLAYLPGANILTPSTILFSERALYLPSAFALVGLCFWLWRCIRSEFGRRILLVACAIFVVAFAVKTKSRSAEHQNALTLAASSLEATPGSARLRSLLGAEYQALGDVERARQEFERALEYDPDCASAMHGLGSLAMALKDYPRAAAWFGKAFVATGGTEQAIAAHACASQVRAQQSERANTTCAKAAQLAPDNPDVGVNLARSYILVGELGKAVKTLEAHTISSPKHKAAFAQLIQLYIANGDTEAATRTWKRARQNFPNDSRIHELGIRGGLDAKKRP